MTSRKHPTIVQRIRGLISEPNPRDLIKLLNDFREQIEAVTAASRRVPKEFRDALECPLGTQQVVGLYIDDVPIKVVLYPPGRPALDRATMLWQELCARVPRWSAMASQAHRMEREELPDEIGAVSLVDAAVVVINTDQPHLSAINAVRALRVLIPAPVLVGANWVTRQIRRPQVAAAVTATAAAAVGVMLAATVINQHAQPHVRLPAIAGPTYSSPSIPSPTSSLPTPVPSYTTAGPNSPQASSPLLPSHGITHSPVSRPPLSTPSASPRRPDPPIPPDRLRTPQSDEPTELPPPFVPLPKSPPRASPRSTPSDIPAPQPSEASSTEPVTLEDECDGKVHVELPPVLDVCIDI